MIPFGFEGGSHVTFREVIVMLKKSRERGLPGSVKMIKFSDLQKPKSSFTYVDLQLRDQRSKLNDTYSTAPCVQTPADCRVRPLPCCRPVLGPCSWSSSLGYR